MNGPPHSLFQDYLNPFSSSYDFFEKFGAVIATGVTTEAIESRIDVNVHTINPGVDTEVFTPAQEDIQNLPKLLRAFNRIHASHPEADLMLVGDGPERDRVESLAEELDLDDVVSFPGYVDNAELPEYYRRAAVFVLSSRRDNHPITLMEAMSCETP
ncbi:MAG: glycosyltransferase, partial [Halobacteriaceae archaeon]